MSDARRNNLLLHTAGVFGRPHLRRLLVRLTAVGAAAVLVLGVWGWLKHGAADSSDDIEIGFATAVYRSLSFFAGESGEAFDVGWQLQIARVWALLVSLSGLLLVGFHRIRTAVGMRCARLARGHRVVVGDPSISMRRLDIDPQRTADQLPTVGVVNDGSARADGAYCDVTFAYDGSAQWVVKSAADRAAEVVVAGLSDHEAVTTARQLLLAPSKGGALFEGQLFVDVRDPDLAQSVDLLFAVEFPDCAIEVGSMVSAQLIGEFEAQLDASSNGRAIALAGDHDMVTAAARFLVSRLSSRYNEAFLTESERLYVIGTGETGQVGEVDIETGHAVAIRNVAIGKTQAPPALRDALVFVLERDPQRRIELDIEIRLWLPHCSMSQLDLTEMAARPNFADGEAAQRILHGPVWAMSNPSSAYFLGDRRDPAGTRGLMTRLSEIGFQVVPLRSSGSETDMTTTDAKRLVDKFDVTMTNAMNSRANLQAVDCDFKIEG